MSRRQTDLEPGVEPDAGEPEYGAPNGRPPTPPPSWRPDTRPPAGPPERRSPRRAPADRAAPTVGGGSSPSLRWVPWIVLALIAAAFVVSSLAGGSSSKADLTYSQFVNQVDDDNVKSIDFNKSTGSISGKFKNAVNGKTEFSSSGPKDNLPDPLLTTIKKKNIDFNYVDDGQQHPRRHPALGPAAHPDHRVVRLDEPTRAGADGRGDEHRPQPGEGLQHREAEDDVRRRRRLRAGEAGDRRGRRLPEEPGQVQGDRRPHPEGRAARGPARHRQDAHRARGRR